MFSIKMQGHARDCTILLLKNEAYSPASLWFKDLKKNAILQLHLSSDTIL